MRPCLELTHGVVPMGRCQCSENLGGKRFRDEPYRTIGQDCLKSTRVSGGGAGGGLAQCRYVEVAGFAPSE